MKLAKDIQVSLVTGVCVLALAVVSKYFIDTELDFISQYGPVWIFIVYIITRDRAEKSGVSGSPLFWSLAIIIATLAIVVVYAI